MQKERVMLSRTNEIRKLQFMDKLDNWLDNQIGEHNPLMKQWSYVFDEDNNQLKFILLIDIEGETNE
tara:strand:+ start:215 stop:415 length:201 start_codon:yes stop_codon:yes gene_type:complete